MRDYKRYRLQVPEHPDLPVLVKALVKLCGGLTEERTLPEGVLRDTAAKYDLPSSSFHNWIYRNSKPTGRNVDLLEMALGMDRNEFMSRVDKEVAVERGGTYERIQRHLSQMRPEEVEALCVLLDMRLR